MVNLDVGFAVDEKGLLQVIDNAAAHWHKTFSNVGMGIDTGIAKVAKAAVDASTATAKKIIETEEEIHKRAVDSANRAASLKVKAEQDYVALKSKYVLAGLDTTRQAIHEEEQAIKKTRDAITRANQEGLDKQATAVLKAERDKQNARLQGLRSVEKEITGARTFSEQLEKNVYEPIKKEAAKGGALTKILFGEIGALQKNLKKTEAEVKEHEAIIAAHAKEASTKIEAQEREHVAKLKALEDQIANAKNAEAKKELEEVKHSIQLQIAEEKKLTQERAAQENLQLQHHKANLEKELADTKAEHTKAKAESDKEAAKGERGGGGAVMGLAGVGVALELFKVGAEKAKEFSEAQAALHAATGLNIKDVEEWGLKYNKTGEEVAIVAAKVTSATGAAGPELKEQTEAVIAYAAANRLSAEAVAKKMATESGRAKIFADAKRNEAIAQAKANDPAMKADFVQKQLMATVGQLASVVMTALAPAISAVQPILESAGELISSVVKPAMDALRPVIEKISGLFVKLAPVITELISSALTALTPILGVLSDTLGTLIDPLIAIVKTIAEALSPVMKSLAPLLTALANIFATQLTAQLQILLPVIADLLPPLMDLLVPVLNLLISIITPLAQLLAGGLNLAIGLVTKALLLIVDKAIKPLVSWLGGELKKKVDETVGFITKAVGAITSIVSSVTSFFGLGEKSAKAAADATKGAGEAAQKEADNQAGIAALNEAKAAKIGLASKLKSGKITAKELQELREQAEGEGDQIMLAKIDAFEKKRAAAGTKGAKSAATAKENVAKANADELLNIAKESIAAQDLTDKQAKAQSTTAEIEHQETILAIALQYHGLHSKQYQSEVRKLQALKVTLKKDERAQVLADNQSDTNDLIAALELRAVKESMTEKQVAEERFKIQQDGLVLEIANLQDGDEQKAKLQATYSINAAKHVADGVKEQMQIANELRKDELETMKEGLDKKLALIDFERKRELENLDLTEAQRAAIKKKYRKQEVDAFEADQKEKIDAAKETAAKIAELFAGADSDELKKNESDFQDSMSKLNDENAEKIAAAQGNANKLLSINREYTQKSAELQKQKAAHEQEIQKKAAEAQNKLIDEAGEKAFGIKNLGMVREEAGVKKFLLLQLKQLAINEAAKLAVSLTSTTQAVAVTTAGEAAKTSAVVAGATAQTAAVQEQSVSEKAIIAAKYIWEKIRIGAKWAYEAAGTAINETAKTAALIAGFAARQAVYIAEGIASAASAAGTWIATAAKAVFNAFETMPFPLDILAAGAAVAGVYELSTLVAGLFGMADGGWVGGAGGDRDDRNPRMLSRNEFVVKSGPASKWAPVLHAINNEQPFSVGNGRGGGTFMLDESQVKRLERNTVFSSQRMLLDQKKAKQQRSRIVI